MLHVLTHSFPTRCSSDLLGLAGPARFAEPHQRQRGAVQRLRRGLQHVVRRHVAVELADEELGGFRLAARHLRPRSEEHTSELQSLMRLSYAVFCLYKNKK